MKTYQQFAQELNEMSKDASKDAAMKAHKAAANAFKKDVNAHIPNAHIEMLPGEAAQNATSSHEINKKGLWKSRAIHSVVDKEHAPTLHKLIAKHYPGAKDHSGDSKPEIPYRDVEGHWTLNFRRVG